MKYLNSDSNDMIPLPWIHPTYPVGNTRHDILIFNIGRRMTNKKCVHPFFSNVQTSSMCTCHLIIRLLRSSVQFLMSET